MLYELTPSLLLASGVVLILGLAVCLRVLSVHSALALSMVKIMLPLAYFAGYFNISWTLVDDIRYYEHGKVLLDLGYDPFNIIFNTEGMELLTELSGGHHTLYTWYNLFSQWIFGQYYYAPVFINVLITFLSGLFLFRLAIIIGFSAQYARGLFFFYTIHWEVLAWSSLLNKKDILVMFMTLAFVYYVVCFLKTKLKIYLSLAFFLAFLFYFLRFYVPIAFIVSICIYNFHQLRLRGNKIALIIFGVFIFAYSKHVGWNEIFYFLSMLDFGPSLIWGSFRMALTPLPWSIDPGYSFLLLPSIMHWIMFFPTIIGGFMLWKERHQLRILFIYLFITLVLYGAFIELQGPRHRVQFVFVYAWAQFHFLWALLCVLKSKIILSRCSA